MGLSEAQRKERLEYLEKNLQITECFQKEPYVFISYAGDNWKAVFQSMVVPLQKRYGMRVYADRAFDNAGGGWTGPVLQNVCGAGAVAAFISQSYIESYACFLELLTAVNHKRRIVFVSMEEKLRLGAAASLSYVEQEVKKEIFAQGTDIAANDDHVSNDIMRAMKAAFKRLSVPLEQDTLSKYDITEAFFHFFDGISIGSGAVKGLGAIRDAISSVSPDVFGHPAPGRRPCGDASQNST